MYRDSKHGGIGKGLAAAVVALLWSVSFCVAVGQERRQPDCQARTVLEDPFDHGQLASSTWRITAANDFQERIVDVTAKSSGGPDNLRLRLRADTLGTDDATVKFLGVVSRQRVDLRTSHEIAFDLDWNDQANGSYLTAGVYLAPKQVLSGAERQPTWFKFEYVGVPPGRNARSVVAKKANGQLKLLFTEGWPAQRIGRRIAQQRVEIHIDTKALQIFENGRLLFSSDALDLPFTDAYLYLQMSSHSNYPAREIFFDNVRVRKICAAASDANP